MCPVEICLQLIWLENIGQIARMRWSKTWRGFMSGDKYNTMVIKKVVPKQEGN